jgi:hypothetical protein
MGKSSLFLTSLIPQSNEKHDDAPLFQRKPIRPPPERPKKTVPSDQQNSQKQKPDVRTKQTPGL